MSAADLYVIGDGSSIAKIGKSVNPSRRLSELQTGHPHRLQILHLEPGAGHLEPELHARFANLRLEGEWFDFGDADPVPTVKAAIDELDLRLKIRREYDAKLDAARKETERWRSEAAKLRQQIEAERLIFAREREHSQQQQEQAAKAILEMHIAAITKELVPSGRRITDELTEAAA